MPVGGCFCGNIRLESDVQPVTSALCHCTDCRKLTGTLFTYSFVFKRPDISITGNPKEIAKSSDSGNRIKNYFCPDCGTPIYGFKIKPSGEEDEILIVRAGIFDDMELLNEQRPVAELYVKGRVGWVCPLEGTQQFEGMLPVPL
ncbi:GFA family protein [Aspergillus puulaauensis]|uniref:CENP-V/GFA domain-containing protein n=1 Tax=Aspergillus puulaauensis TaxID=1220207 RepID=A0A7R7XT45_9EURO|nr:uncharacterized protein APUU_60304S [Aspergillus puulaauensis]BCS27256.1 hypothetical protein APUU_60304S [Aspergillus puulaauensis]